MSYLIPADQLTLSDIKGFKQSAQAAAFARVQAKMGMAVNEQQLRQWLNMLDAAPAPLEQWNTAALAVIGTPYSVFQNQATVTLPANKLAVFWGVSIETIPLPVSRLQFRSGAAAGNLLADYDLEPLADAQNVVGFFNQAVVMDPQFTFACNVICRIATGAVGRVKLLNYVFEPIGQTIA
jgi:hypothetical protein